MIDMLITGIMLGFLYALIALGLSVSICVMEFTNLAFGSLVITAGYCAYALYTYFIVDPLLSLCLIVPAFFCVGWVLYKYVLSRVRNMGDAEVLLTFCISLIVDNLLLLIFNPQPKTLTPNYAISTVSIAGASLQLQFILNSVFSLCLFLFTYMFLRKTRLGLNMLAAAQSPQLALARGINIKSIFAITVGFSFALAGFAGISVGLTHSLTPTSGVIYLLISICAVGVGGLGNILGTLLGGLILGISQVMTGYYLGVGYQTIVGFIILLVVLSVKPKGLFSR